MWFSRNRQRLEAVEKKLAELAERQIELWEAIEPMELKYRELYETARRNLAKLAQRAKEQEDGGDTGRQDGEDPVVKARALLLQRKLGRS